MISVVSRMPKSIVTLATHRDIWYHCIPRISSVLPIPNLATLTDAHVVYVVPAKLITWPTSK